MAKFDIKSNIEYIKKITGNSKISYLCHSQGCSQFFLGYTLDPEFFQKNVDKFGTMGAVLSYKNVVKSFYILMKSFFNLFFFLE
jgi:hypothetical protein